MATATVAEETLSARRARMAVLADADSIALMECWKKLGLDPEFAMVRGPETGLIALRGRIGGGGDPFNFGEATVTRATVRLANGAIGHAMALGRDAVKAKLSAVIDALSEDLDCRARIDETIIAPLAEKAASRDRTRAAETEATKVDFFTLVRGEDE